MASFAEIIDGIVVRVIEVRDLKLEGFTQPLTIEDAKQIPVLANQGGDWVQTSHHFRGKFAAKGDVFENDTFIRVQSNEEEE